MDFLNFVSGDNLFKYSFTLGLVMLVFSIVYPFQKRQEIEMERLNLIKDLQILNYDLKKSLEHKKDATEELTDLVIESELISKKVIKNKNFSKKVERFFLAEKKVEEAERILTINKITTEATASKIRFLELEMNVYAHYFNILEIAGIFFTMFGFVFWSIQTFKKPKQTTNP